MSKRYEEEISLRLRGDKAECQKYIARARTVLGEVWVRDIELGGLDQAWRSVILDQRAMVTVYATKYHTPIVTITVLPITPKTDQKFIDQLRMVWVPEGLIFTPVSEQYEKGWGLPTRDKETGEVLAYTDPISGEALHPIGVAGGIWPQVILNRFKNNKYLDKKEFIAGLPNEVIDRVIPDNPLLREAWDTAVAGMDTFILMLPWQGVYNPLRCADIEGGELANDEDTGLIYWAENQFQYPQVPGAYIGDTLVFPQFGAYASDPLIFEAEVAPDEVTGDQEWFAHRAEEVLYFTAAQEGCFQQTNVIRAAVDRGPMHRIVRGHPNVARMAVTEVFLSRKQFHDSDAFRPGYNKVTMRTRSAVGNVLQAGENLLITPDAAGDFDSGVAAAEVWRGSPPHYANQIYSDWTEDEDIPGAEHFTAYLPATVDEALYAGELAPPVSGIEWCQLFTRQQSWVAIPFQYHDIGPRFVGNYGKVSKHCYDRYYGQYYLFIAFMGGFIPIPNELIFADEEFDPERIMGVFGAASFEGYDGQAMFRCVVCVSPYMQVPTPPNVRDFAEFTLYVLSRPIAVTDNVCDWAIEVKKTFAFDDNWVPAMPGGVTFSPNGKKFVFGMHKRGGFYDSALSLNTEDFTHARTETLSPRRTIELIHVEFEATDAIVVGNAPTYAFTEHREEPLIALINCGTRGERGDSDHWQWYQRSLEGAVNLFAGYDDDNALIYVRMEVYERSHQEFIDTAGSSDGVFSNWCYRVRKLIFPSEKEVYLMQQYMRGTNTEEDIVAIQANGWPLGDGTAESFFSMIHYINVRDEDIVYTKRYSRQKAFLRRRADTSLDLYPTHYEYGRLEIVFNGGVKNVGGNETNVVEILYTESEQYYSDAELAPYNCNYVPTKGWVDFSMRDSGGVYQMDITPAAAEYSVTVDAQIIGVHPALSLPTAFVDVATDVESQNPSDPLYKIFRRGAYNGNAPINVDHRIGRPPYTAHECSVILGVTQRWGWATGSGLWWGSSLWDESYFTTNIAPITLSEYASRCQVARYKDRIMLRVENFMWPWGGQGEFTLAGTTPDLLTDIVTGVPSELFPDWSIVPEDAKLIIWANFDLDEAAGISDVTDIQPFGRAG